MRKQWNCGVALKPNKFNCFMLFFVVVFLSFSGTAEVGKSIFKEGLAWDQT